MSPSLIIDVGPVLSEAGATTEVDADVPLESMLVGDAHVAFVAQPHLRAVIANAGDILVVSGTVRGRAILECSRCLEPFELEISGTVDAVLSVDGPPEDIADDQEWYPIEGETADLLPAAESALRVEVPFAPVHDESCKGICPTCGCDLNTDTCTCTYEAHETPDGPFASLKDLLGDDEE